VAIRHEYRGLFADDASWQARGAALAERTLDLTTFLTRVAHPKPAATAREHGQPAAAVTYHPFCQSLNVLGLDAELRELIEGLLGLELRPLPEANVCCGFGGSTSFEHPEVARGIAARKLANVAATGAGTLVTDNPGCLLHLRGALDAAGQPVRALHLAELVAERLAASPAARP
jgi:Fe-S oxidoreductase